MAQNRTFLFAMILLGIGACNPKAGQVDSASGATTPAAEPCSGKWAQVARYTPGSKVSLQGVNYEAAMASVGQSPQTASSVGRSALVWHRKGVCAPPVEAGNGNGPAGASDPCGTMGMGPDGSLPPGSDPGAGGLPSAGGFGAKYIMSPYKDLTVNANWNSFIISTAVTGTLTPLLDVLGDTQAVTWSFASGECGTETWGGITADQVASANVAAWAAAKKGYIISTGGAAGSFTCATDAGFMTFLDRYHSEYLLGVDFDIEAGQTKAVLDQLVARVKAAQKLPKYSKLRFSFTLATFGGNVPESLGAAGVTTLKAISDAGLTDYTINLMVMDYGSSIASNCVLNAQGLCDMGLSATQAAANLNAAFGVPFDKIELTPMIGGNDTLDETFTLDDVQVMMQYAAQKKLAGIHYWSFDRDTDCAQATASPVCNSYGKPGSNATAGPLGFMKRFLQAQATP